MMRRWWTALALIGVLLSQTAWAQTPPRLEQATFAGGCFWCMEAMFEQLNGVESVTSGLMGGQEEGLTEQQIAAGEGGHAEVIFLLYDPQVISYPELLQAFFAAHDPTSVNKQGENEGIEYRSVIFTFNDEQKKTAESVIDELTRAGIYSKPIVTQVLPAGKFHLAAENHQDYYSKNSESQYCKRVITPEVAKFRKIFADKVKKEPQKS
jgi:peptide-methionine (S)-S-oxide reductase